MERTDYLGQLHREIGEAVHALDELCQAHEDDDEATGKIGAACNRLDAASARVRTFGEPAVVAAMQEIDRLSHEDMARLQRFALSGHPYFVSGPVADYFGWRFHALGGMTTEISKRIGWDG